MEVYTLDSLLRRSEVIDRFESLIWTERFAASGDFELTVASNRDMRSIFKPKTMLSINNSKRVMTVETVEDGTDDEGKATLSIKGRSLEVLLDSRIAITSMTDEVTTVPWSLTGTPGNVARQIFDDICRDGVVDPGDVIPMLITGSIYPIDTIVEPATSITVDIPPTSVYAAITDLCEAYDLGFRLVRSPETPQLYFDIYVGNDRTSSQTVLPPIIFSPELDNLQNTTELVSIAGEKNVAYVITPVGSLIVTPDGVDPEVAGFERRVLVVQADDITSETVDPEAAMLQRGKAELAKNRSVRAFDGELAQNIPYKYDVDYMLGDIVEMRNSDGATNRMRITEQIFVADGEGERAYPTLTLNQFIMPGTWIAWDYNQTWLDLDDDPMTWADQP